MNPPWPRRSLLPHPNHPVSLFSFPAYLTHRRDLGVILYINASRNPPLVSSTISFSREMYSDMPHGTYWSHFVNKSLSRKMLFLKKFSLSFSLSLSLSLWNLATAHFFGLHFSNIYIISEIYDCIIITIIEINFYPLLLLSDSYLIESESSLLLKYKCKKLLFI